MGVTRRSVELRVAGIRDRVGLPGASSLRHAVLALQYNEIRELRAKLQDVFEIEGLPGSNAGQPTPPQPRHFAQEEPQPRPRLP
jgi:hypothetical protein